MKHILLYGERRSGKSTLITEIMESFSGQVFGYVTRRLSDTKEGFHPIYIHPVGEYLESVRTMEEKEPGSARGVRLSGLRYEEKNLIAWCDGKQHEPNLEAFNRLGASYIRQGFGHINSEIAEVGSRENQVPGIESLEINNRMITKDETAFPEGQDGTNSRMIIMDEIGFLEGQAEEFKQTVTEALEGEVPVIAGVKMYPECDFTNRILKLENVHVFKLTPENRADVKEQVWNIIINEWGYELS